MRRPPSRGARMTVRVSYIRCQSYNPEIDSFPCKRPAGRPYFFYKGVLAYAPVQKRYSLPIHHFFMSSLHIYEGMKVATLVATLRLRIMCMIQNSSKMFWRFYLQYVGHSTEFFKNVLKILYAVCGSNTRWILKHFWPDNMPVWGSYTRGNSLAV